MKELYIKSKIWNQ